MLSSFFIVEGGFLRLHPRSLEDVHWCYSDKAVHCGKPVKTEPRYLICKWGNCLYFFPYLVITYQLTIPKTDEISSDINSIPYCILGVKRNFVPVVSRNRKEKDRSRHVLEVHPPFVVRNYLFCDLYFRLTDKDSSQNARYGNNRFTKGIIPSGDFRPLYVFDPQRFVLFFSSNFANFRTMSRMLAGQIGISIKLDGYSWSASLPLDINNNSNNNMGFAFPKKVFITDHQNRALR